jgi:ferrochelatase
MNDIPTQPLIAPSHRPPEHPPVASGGIGVLLVNLGTPDATDAESVRRYLKEFLADKRVIEENGLLWKIVLNGFILRFRPKRKGKDYDKIWNRDRNESPLKTITRAQAEKLASLLDPLGKHVVVDWAMRYGNPSIASRLAALAEKGCERILLVPLYPQYAAATTATVCDETFRVLMKMRWQPALRVAPPYFDEPVYIEALASTLETELSRLPFKPDVILASFHGIPKEYFVKGDPYYCHCAKTMRLLRERLKVDEDKLRMTFQSRFGRTEWLQPYTDMTVKSLAKQGVKNLAVITPGFSADCLETLEEIAVENAHIFTKNGGENFVHIPCLNDSEPGMLVIWTVALRELKGWV